jgi:hypothetical protein
MKTLLITLATLMVGQAQAGLLNSDQDLLKTSVRCVAKDDASEMYFKTQVDSEDVAASAIEIADMAFLPQMVDGNKSISVKIKGQEANLGAFDFGDSGSSAVTLPITSGSGKVYYCNIKQEKVK